MPSQTRVTGPGRYAPTPTSDLHLGNLRTAVIAWALARRSGTGFVLRVENLDQQRVAAAPAVAQRQLDDLTAIGLDWDGEPMVQSRRLEAYTEAVARLDTYECFCTRRDIAEASQAPHDGHRPYPGTCRDLTDDERAVRRLTRPPALRVRAAGASQQVFDLFAGEVTGEVDDFVVVRGDGTPAYNLAVVVDDLAQGVQHVTRGRDLLESAPRQAWLAQQLGGGGPDTWVHLGLALNKEGRRLAKRDGAVSLADLAATGVGPSEVFAMLAASWEAELLTSAQQLLSMDEVPWQRLLAAAARDWVL
ncbi:tRNA glutamyl-Q(34) synthetase GluQRS [Aestuariimicrobium ganziense]|uniref:tRNA glutamyl-Q(34) synthetase GluQRS n=1 Tax=Aestuariimicrobium ganziense TaxID=2773677 RepID=UPI002E282692|nr:tRNA glutamyl-Q(34) synthetase GluQRS [Aestuariimicrobium ganziense]